MGKGDRKTRKGKITIGSFGKTRKRNKATVVISKKEENITAKVKEPKTTKETKPKKESMKEKSKKI